MRPSTRNGNRTPSARERLLDAAAHRFYADGVNATGIDRIIADAGVAKASLYNNFASKGELVLAYLAERHSEWLDLLAARDELARSPEGRVLAVFDAYLDHARPDIGDGFRGCGQLNAAAEFPAGDPARALVRRQKEEVEALLRTRVSDALGEGTPRATAAALAEQLSYLLEGAVARAGLEEHEERLLRARAIAADMLAHAAGEACTVHAEHAEPAEHAAHAQHGATRSAHAAGEEHIERSEHGPGAEAR